MRRLTPRAHLSLKSRRWQITHRRSHPLSPPFSAPRGRMQHGAGATLARRVRTRPLSLSLTRPEVGERAPRQSRPEWAAAAAAETRAQPCRRHLRRSRVCVYTHGSRGPPQAAVILFCLLWEKVYSARKRKIRAWVGRKIFFIKLSKVAGPLTNVCRVGARSRRCGMKNAATWRRRAATVGGVLRRELPINPPRVAIDIYTRANSRTCRCSEIFTDPPHAERKRERERETYESLALVRQDVRRLELLVADLHLVGDARRTACQGGRRGQA